MKRPGALTLAMLLAVGATVGCSESPAETSAPDSETRPVEEVSYDMTRDPTPAEIKAHPELFLPTTAGGQACPCVPGAKVYVTSVDHGHVGGPCEVWDFCITVAWCEGMPVDVGLAGLYGKWKRRVLCPFPV